MRTSQTTPETITTIGRTHSTWLGWISGAQSLCNERYPVVSSNTAFVPRCLIGMEACSGSHHIGRELTALGHDVRRIPAQHVKPFLKEHKNNCRDAEAVAEAVQRPTMSFVVIKTPEQLDLLALHRVRSRLVGQRTGTINQIRGFLIERGFIVRQGVVPLRKALPDILSSNTGIGRLGCTIFRRGVWVGCRRLLRLLADRHDVRRRLPDLFIGQHISPGRHTEAPLVSAIGNRLEDLLGVKLALRQIDAASAVQPMTMGTLLSQKKIMARRNHFRVFEVRNVFFREGHLANEDPCNDHHHKSARHGNYPDR
jgi:hypothetical protein